MAALRCEVVAARAKHTATVLMMHGLGDSSAGWSFIADQYPALKHIKWIFPNAPERSVTINMGMSIPAWYDIYALGDDAEKESRHDQKGILESVRQINQIIADEIDNNPEVPGNRIVVGGFSQGGVIALATGLTSERKLAGIAALSCYLPMSEKMPSMMTDSAKTLPVFWGHGDADPVVKHSWAKDSVKIMQEKLKMTNVDFKTYPRLVHSASPQELRDLEAWFNQTIPADTEPKM